MHEAAFDARGSAIRWTDVPGRGPARVFLHGLGSSGTWVWGEVAQDPRLGGHRSLVLDLPGFGHSDRPDDWGYTLDDHAAAVATVCAAAGVRGIDLVGHSLGGDVAVVAAARNPGLVRRLVISEANLDPLPADPHGDRASQRIVAEGEAAFLAGGFERLLSAAPGWAPTLRQASPLAFFRSARGLIEGTTPTMRELFYGLAVPGTFINGEVGEPLRDADGMRAAGIRLETVPRAGHMIMEDEPGAYVEAVARGLAFEG
jgi:pimeloyl-ACP methyl ester carboxylesterase